MAGMCGWASKNFEAWFLDSMSASLLDISAMWVAVM